MTIRRTTPTALPRGEIPSFGDLRISVFLKKGTETKKEERDERKCDEKRTNTSWEKRLNLESKELNK
jgi:hypothetical protein